MSKFAASSEFWQQFKDGEHAALGQVYTAYVGEVEALVRRLIALSGRPVPSSGSVDVGDLVQEAFIRAFGRQARSSFDASRDYGPFLGALTRNLVIDWAKKHGREVPTGDVDRLSDTSLPDSENWADRETMAAVNQYLADLPAELRDVHEYRYVQCRSQDDTCAALSISRQALRTREKHLREGLRRFLKRRELAFGGEPRDGRRRTP